MNTQDKVLVSIEVDKSEFLSEILGSGFDYWHWWYGVKYSDGYNWDKHPDDNDEPFLTLTIENPYKQGNTTRVVSVNQILEGFRMSKYRRWEDFDACQGDYIMQCVLFGEAVYG